MSSRAFCGVGGLHHSWGFFTGGAGNATWRVVWRVLRAPLAWKEEGCDSVMVVEMFALEQIICKLCGDFMYPPIWPGRDWRG